MDIYGQYKDSLEAVMRMMAASMERYAKAHKDDSGELIYEHLRYRLKSEKSMQAKLEARGLPLTPYSALCEVRDAIDPGKRPEAGHEALCEVRDAIGFRVVCRFIDDIYKNISRIKNLPGITVVKEKDYILDVKSNGYRSYHMILSVEAPYEDVRGDNPGHFFVEIQLRTIAMDSWASLEHEMKYKHHIRNAPLIEQELKRCADELTSCDISMQTIRKLIREEGGTE